MNSEIRRYVGLTYLITWAFTIPFVIVWNTVLDRTFAPWALIFLPGAYGPTIAALILTKREGGGEAVRELLRTLLMWRVAPVWYLFALAAPIGVVALAVVLSGAPEAYSDFDLWAGLSLAPLAMLAALPFGPLAEELGWRGFAQPRLLASGGLWNASLIIGVVWTFWHTPMFWFPGAAIPSIVEVGPASVSIYLAQITAEACLMTFLYVVSGGSVLLAVLYHTTFNTAETILFAMLGDLTVDQQYRVWVTGIILSWCLAAILLTFLKRRLVSESS